MGTRTVCIIQLRLWSTVLDVLGVRKRDLEPVRVFPQPVFRVVVELKHRSALLYNHESALKTVQDLQTESKLTVVVALGYAAIERFCARDRLDRCEGELVALERRSVWRFATAVAACSNAPRISSSSGRRIDSFLESTRRFLVPVHSGVVVPAADP